jgi:hypothetical protein
MNQDGARWLDLLVGESGGDLRLPMLSGSMAGALLPGDELWVRRSGGRRAHIGDIIVFREPGRLVAHRLIFAFRFKSLRLYIQKGDANAEASRVVEGDIVGIVGGASRNGEPIRLRTPEALARGRRKAMGALIGLALLGVPRAIARRMRPRHA